MTGWSSDHLICNMVLVISYNTQLELETLFISINLESKSGKAILCCF